MSILKIESGNFATSLTTASLTQNQSITLPNASGELTLRSQLATVATSGSYNDLSNKPSFPATPNAYVTQTWRSGASWYRRWSDGFIEQGGSLSANSAIIAVVFPIAFSNSNWAYTSGGEYYTKNTGTPMVALCLNTKTATGATFENRWDGRNQNFNLTCPKCTWYACGY